MKLCPEAGRMKLREIAELFNVGIDSAVSRSVPIRNYRTNECVCFMLENQNS